MIRSPAQTPLVEFKAGMLNKTGTTVKADDRKGYLQLVTDPDLDGCTKLRWLDRRSRNVLEELMVFPNDAEWTKVDQCKDGRVYVLKFKGSDRRFFFWMQEPSDAKDEEYAKAVNKALGNETTEAPAGGDTAMANDAQTTADEGESSKETETTGTAAAEKEAPVAMETDDQGDTSPTAGAQDKAGVASSDMAQLAQILGNATKYQKQLSDEQGIDLNDILSPDTMMSLMENPQFRNSLLEAMPESAEKTPEEFKAMVKSNSFKQALRGFQQALQMGQLGPVMEQFGLDGNAGALGSIQAFVDALEKHAGKGGEHR